MNKKLIALILAVIMALGCVSVAAAVIPGEDQAGAAGLYLKTAPVPAAAVSYAKNSIGSYEDIYAVVSHTAYTVGTDHQGRTTATSAVLTAAAAADTSVTVNAAAGIDFVLEPLS